MRGGALASPEPGDARGTLGAPRAVSGPALAAPRLGQLCVCLEPEALSSLCIRRDKALSLRVRVNGPGLILQLPEIENEKHLGFRSYSENLSKAHKSRPCLEGRLGRNRGGRDHESHLWVQWVGGGLGFGLLPRKPRDGKARGPAGLGFLPCAREAMSTAARPDKRAGQGPRRRVFPAPEARPDTQAPRCQLLVTGTTLSDRGALIPRCDPVPEARSIRKQRDLGEPSGGTVSDLRELLTGSTPRSGRAVAQAPELRPRECSRPPAALRPLTGPLSSDTGSGRGTRHPVSPSLLGRCQPRRRPLALGRTSARAHSLRRWLEGARTFPRRLWAPWRRILLLLGRLLALLAKDWARRGRRGVAGSRRWGASLSTLHPVVTEAPRA